MASAGDAVVAPHRLLQPFADHPGWHTAVAGAAGTDKCVRPDLLDLRAIAKPHCPLRDPTAKPPTGRREANGRIIAMLGPPANLAMQFVLEENSLRCCDLNPSITQH